MDRRHGRLLPVRLQLLGSLSVTVADAAMRRGSGLRGRCKPRARARMSDLTSLERSLENLRRVSFLYARTRTRESRMKTILIVSCLTALPSTAFAQAIAGSVRSAAGTLLPGVAVVATSPALIEQTRTTVTDSHGRYRLEHLRLGTYSVRFSLAGWQSSQREGIELTGSFTTIVDATLAVGAARQIRSPSPASIRSSTLTPLGASATLGGDVVRSIPTARSYNALLRARARRRDQRQRHRHGTATASFPILRRPDERGAPARSTA